jgi:hypothetical protein
MSTAELQSAENGIWMCYRHGKLIDTDETTYSADILLTGVSLIFVQISG